MEYGMQVLTDIQDNSFNISLANLLVHLFSKMSLTQTLHVGCREPKGRRNRSSRSLKSSELSSYVTGCRDMGSGHRFWICFYLPKEEESWDFLASFSLTYCKCSLVASELHLSPGKDHRSTAQIILAFSFFISSAILCCIRFQLYLLSLL